MKRVLVLTVAAALGATSLNAQRPDSSAAGWTRILARAGEAQRAGNDKLARILYDSVLMFDPRNPMALAYKSAAVAPIPESYRDSVDKAFRAQLDSEALERQRYDDSLKRARDTSGYWELPARSFTGEAIMLLVLIGLVCAFCVLWLKLAPDGYTSEDEVKPTETLLWHGAPRRGWYVDAKLLQPIFGGLLWLTIVYFAMGLRLAPLLDGIQAFAMISLALVLLGVWQLVGPYFAAVRYRRCTTYVLTDKRALITTGTDIREYRIKQLEELKSTQHADGTWTLSSTQAPDFFRHIADGEQVREFIRRELAELKTSVREMKKPAS